jgi:hypothetical protein
MEELQAAKEGSGTRVPPTRAQAHENQGDEVSRLSLRDRPIDLVDIARVLGVSANVERPGAPVRDWRDDLTLIRESLGYARAVLTADVAILSQPGSPGLTGSGDVAGELPGVLAAGPGDELWSEPKDGGIDPDIDGGLFVRADHLLAVHREMARVNLSSPAATARVRVLVEDQLTILTERQAAVEARLQQIRSVVIRRYREDLAQAREEPA